MDNQYLLIFTCKDTYGIISAITTFLSDCKAFIHELSEFGDKVTGNFFLRCHFRIHDLDTVALNQKFTQIGERFQADWKFVDILHKPKTLILVSKYSHCLNDLLYRYQFKKLDLDLQAVISNHPDLAEMTSNYNVPFFHFPITSNNTMDQEKKILSFIMEKNIELVILARYMRILSPLLLKHLPGKIINIHHSFLPSFIGARPYQQAFDRGVKIIGATAHYVTTNLDEGPIIEQDTFRIDHIRRVEDLIYVGNDIEVQVLARAVNYHIQFRIFINGNKTVIFK